MSDAFTSALRWTATSETGTSPGRSVALTSRINKHAKRTLMVDIRRSICIWKIWKLRRRAYAMNRHGQAERMSPNDDHDPQIVRQTRAILQSLDDANLRALVKALQRRSSLQPVCVRVDRDISRSTEPLESILCLLKCFRWPSLKGFRELKAVPACCLPLGSCLNPYHYSRMLLSEEIATRPRCRMSTELHSTDSGCYDAGSVGSVADDLREWCTVSYWEEDNRLGSSSSVRGSTVAVSGVDTPGPTYNITCMCGPATTRLSEHVRRRIGLGFLLAKEPGEIWLYNLSEAVLFASSTLWAPPDIGLPPVRRIPPGHCLKVHDSSAGRFYHRSIADRLVCLESMRRRRSCGSSGAASGGMSSADGESRLRKLVDCVFVSFVKGWGESYTRRYIDGCPCWIEIELEDRRHEDDRRYS